MIKNPIKDYYSASYKWKDPNYPQTEAKKLTKSPRKLCTSLVCSRKFNELSILLFCEFRIFSYKYNFYFAKVQVFVINIKI
jgi:hypothetical protein